MSAESTTGPIRRYPRMAAEFTVAYRRRGPTGELEGPHVSRTRSVGLGGVMFEAAELLEPGTALRLEIVIGDRTVVTDARVVYVDRDAGEPFATGVEFTGLSDDDRDFLLGCYLQQEYRLSPE